jgi:hypothetical protein
MPVRRLTHINQCPFKIVQPPASKLLCVVDGILYLCVPLTEERLEDLSVTRIKKEASAPEPAIAQIDGSVS